MDHKPRILIVTPKFPWPVTGACEQDRSRGIQDFIKYGYEVIVLTKIHPQQAEIVKQVSSELNIQIYPIIYIPERPRTLFEKIASFFRRFSSIGYFDGAAFEYSDPMIQKKMREICLRFKPDIVWFDYTYLWPLYKIARSINAKIITRSINIESIHYMDENGGCSFVTLIKSIPKWISEYRAAQWSDHLFSISVHEEGIYRWLGAKSVSNLPLRNLPKFLSWNAIVHDRFPLRVFFFGSTYNVSHNKEALRFLLQDLIPRIHARFPGKYSFTLFGNKFPSEFASLIGQQVEYKGFVDDMDKALFDMDIAVIPSLFGSGMQQKIFEPLTRGFPVVTSSRGLMGYPFAPNHDVLVADTVQEYEDAFEKLLSMNERQKLSNNAKEVSKRIFDQSIYNVSIQKHFD